MTNITFDIDAMTLGQAEFITEYTGLNLDELTKALESQTLSAKAVVAIVATGINPENPEEALDEARAVKIQGLTFDTTTAGA